MYPYQLDMLLPFLPNHALIRLHFLTPYFMETNIMPAIHHMPNLCFLIPLQSIYMWPVFYTKPIQITTFQLPSPNTNNM